MRIAAQFEFTPETLGSGDTPLLDPGQTAKGKPTCVPALNLRESAPDTERANMPALSLRESAPGTEPANVLALIPADSRPAQF